MIGIILATDLEAPTLLDKFKYDQKETINGHNFYHLKIANQKVLLAISGYGKVNAAVTATILINHFHCTKIINIGSCGNINPNFKIYDILIVKSIQYGDVDATSFGYQYGQVPKEILTYNFKLKDLLNYLQDHLKDNHFHEGLLVTTESFLTKQNYQTLIGRISKQFDIADMEACAISQVCHHADVDLVVIKIISDNVFDDHSNTSQWSKSLKVIDQMIQAILVELINFYH